MGDRERKLAAKFEAMRRADRDALQERMAVALYLGRVGDAVSSGSLPKWHAARKAVLEHYRSLADLALRAIEGSPCRIVYYPMESEEAEAREDG